LYQDLLWEHQEPTDAHKTLLANYDFPPYIDFANIDFMSECCSFSYLVFSVFNRRNFFLYRYTAVAKEPPQVKELLEQVSALQGKVSFVLCVCTW
jgi:hypothetical protein